MMAMMTTATPTATATAGRPAGPTAAHPTTTSPAQALPASAVEGLQESLRMNMTSGLAAGEGSASGQGPAAQAGASARPTIQAAGEEASEAAATMAIAALAAATMAIAAAATATLPGRRMQRSAGGMRPSGGLGTSRTQIATCCHHRRHLAAGWARVLRQMLLPAVWVQQQLRLVLLRVRRSGIWSVRSLRLSWHAWQLSWSG